MFRKIAATLAALGLSVTAASAATPIEFDGDGHTYFGSTSFAPPSEGMYQYVHVRWTSGEPIPGGLLLRMDYQHRWLYWDYGMDTIWGNEGEYSETCFLGQPCFSIVGEGHAIGRIEMPRGQGSIEDCQPGHKGSYCYERYVPFGAWFEADFADSGGPPVVYFELGKAGAVPEPATWAMMITGFGLAGTALRRRRTAYA